MTLFRLLSSLLIPAAVLLQSPQAISGEAVKNELSVLKEDTIDKSGWKSVVNETFRFSLQVPVQSHIDGHRVSGNYEYIRIQNYQSIGDSVLRHGTFWLEIFIFDHKITRRVWEPCADLIVNETIESRDGEKIFIGNPRDVSPDAGGRVRSLCAETEVFDIYVQAAENDKDTPTLNKIYESFRIATEMSNSVRSFSD